MRSGAWRSISSMARGAVGAQTTSQPAFSRTSLSLIAWVGESSTSMMRWGRSTSRLLPAGDELAQARGDLGQRQRLAGRPQADRGAGHAVDDGGRFVLGDGVAPRGAQLAQAVGAVLAHAGQQ